MDFKPTPVGSALTLHNLYSVILDTYDSGFIYPGEQHDFWEFSYVLGGCGGLTAEEKIYHCYEGQAVIHNPNIFHSMWVEGDEPYKILTVSFDGAGLFDNIKPGCYELNDEERGIITMLLRELSGLSEEDGKNALDHYFNKIPPDSINTQMFKNLLELLLLSLARRGSTMNSHNDVNSGRYSKLIAFLKENINRSLTIEMIAQETFESSGTIKDLFRQFTGGGVMSYFNHIRCERVIQLLAEGYNVKAIAEIMEFSSPYYLSFFFKREMGMTIREFMNKWLITL